MRNFRIFLLLVLLCWVSGQGVFLYAQDDDDDSSDDDISVETDWDGYVSDLYSRGDQTFTISLGVVFPAIFHDSQPAILKHNFFPVGGAGSLAYSYFLGSHFFLGVELGVNFNYTLGQNTIFIIPLGARVGWQFLLRRFEFPIYLTVGVAPERYLNSNYAGLFVKLGASGFFRFNPDWSFGLSADWNWYPQWPRENGKPAPAKNTYANIIGVTLAARYHF